jgi:DHA2 family multidrug resistance protein
MMSVARNLGGSVALSAIASFQDERFDFHHARIVSTLAANSADVQSHVAANAAMLGGGPDGLTGALRMIDGQVSLEALVMTFNDLFLALTVASLLVLPLVVFLKPIKPGDAPALGH